MDDDLGFVMWLGELFNELGCEALPALDCREAMEVARTVELPIATLVANPELPGAAETVQALTIANPGLRVVLIRDLESDTPSSAIQALVTLDRPSPWDAISHSEWLAKLRTLLAASAGA